MRDNVTEIVRKVTALMGNTMRLLRDEKGYSKEKEIKVNQKLKLSELLLVFIRRKTLTVFFKRT